MLILQTIISFITYFKCTSHSRYKINLKDHLPWSTANTNCLTYMNNRYFTTYDRDYDYHVGRSLL